MAVARTDDVGVVVVGVVVPFEAASFRPRDEVSCEVGESLGQLRARDEELSITGVLNFPGRETD